KEPLVSNLTKVLVVLLTLSAIFLCGVVVTYATSAANYRAKYDDAVTDNQAKAAAASLLRQQLNEGLKARQDENTLLQQQISRLVAENANLQSEALTLRAAKDELQERIVGWSGTVQKNTLIVADLQQQLAATRTELDKARNELVTDRGQLSQVRAALEERTLQLRSLERENMRLVEDRAALEVRPGGRAAAVSPVTALAGTVRPAPAPTTKLLLEGVVREVRMGDRLASLSIGTASGVKVGDVLHVIRGDQYVCDIVITNVDIDSSVGQITMMKAGHQPQPGDTVTNRL
ncbi:MAG TPA: hypothetical protein VLH60_07455, partial [Sedimentisphaerales bacterium]|nr:hypothetical protein [Sedimentisphaerales bacterium]